ncbi:MAG: 30S ribosome-binding factor RbfA [Chloroflexi bacterium]|nr:30S ribosome-binding factor RbfA [Chloroflexota bacterium]
MATKKRQGRTAEFIKEVMGELISTKLKDPRLAMTTITDATITQDLRQATVWYSVLGTDEEIEAAAEGLRSAAGWLRRELGTQLHLRFVPELFFKRDDSWERGFRVDTLLEKIAAEKANHDATRQPEDADS